MRQPDTIPGFAVRQEFGAARKRLLLLRSLVVMLPLAGLLVIDVTDRWTAFRPVLLLLPLLDLRNQVIIWCQHLGRFGFPPLRHCRRMLYLDRLRGYDPMSGTIHHAASYRVSGLLVGSFVIAALLWWVWLSTGYVV